MNLNDIVKLNLSGTPKAMPSFCTANGYVLDDILSYTSVRELPVLVEATCNQVNQYGGYTGMKPADFVGKLHSKADHAGLRHEDLILGGDHLGPNPWQHLRADDAMNRAKTLVKDYVEAGFTKIHLDASMDCGNEPTPSFELVAQRSAELCDIAEKYAPKPDALSYVIGTEVPVPGGEADDMEGIRVTSAELLAQTINTHDDAFKAAGVGSALDRVIAVVVQPGVDFSHDGIIHYEPSDATELVKAIKNSNGIGFEAHSTDYQSTDGLAALVRDHSVALKVGPELTFHFREGVMALDHVENHTISNGRANAIKTILHEMDEDPSNWENYYNGSDEEIQFLKLFSYSDRIRYYWDKPNVNVAVEMLLNNLGRENVRAAAASQYGVEFPVITDRVSPRELITQRVNSVVERYYKVTGWV